MWRALSIKLLPPTCVLCGASTRCISSLCIACEQRLPYFDKNCTICATVIHQNSSELCGTCQHHPPPFDRLVALYPYEPPIVHLILSLKFHQQLPIAQWFGEALVKKLRTNRHLLSHPLPTSLIPMPLHDSRLKERGFNQALEIARPISRALNIPLDTRGVMRVKPTAAQHSLNALARKQNMQQAFVATKDYTHACIAIIDDVVTTQATVSALSRTLRAAGATRIEIWCIARAMLR